MTRQQHALLNFISGFVARKGYSPSYQEMQDAMGLSSKSSVARLVNALAERGMVVKEANGARSVQPTMTGKVYTLPVVRITPEAMKAAQAGAESEGVDITDYVSDAIHFYGVGHR